MIDVDAILPLLGAHLARQRWFDHDAGPDHVEVAASERWVEGDPTCWWLLVDAVVGDEAAGRYQLLLGARSATVDHEFLHHKDVEIVGTVETAAGPVVVYDALVDPTLAVHLLHRTVPGATAFSVRPLLGEQSNSSVVYDEKQIVKLFRRVHVGANPDVAALAVLDAAGFDSVPTQLGVLTHEDQDLAVARTFLRGASDGWNLALTSLRILFADHGPAAASGGDFGPDARRLGSITARLHLALAEASGVGTIDLDAVVARFREQLDRVRDTVPAQAIEARYAEVAAAVGAMPAVHIHGDLHLGQWLRADDGWYVIDFEGEPARPVAERTEAASPLRDVAGMLRSFHYAAEVVRRDHGEQATELLEAANDWEHRARQEFLAAYRATPGIEAILPPSSIAETLLRAFELDKAVYEVAYEVGYRPTWVDIPLGAIHRLVADPDTT